MTNEKRRDVSAQPLSARVEKLRQEAQRVVAAGIEHPSWELTRQASFDRSDLRAKADFIKLVHGIANAHSEEERFLIVGADHKNRQFVSVTNCDSFDPAMVIPFLTKYLQPTPRVEVFNLLRTDDDVPFVLLVFESKQPRPITAISDIQNGKGNRPFCQGQIWLKEGTALRIATANDIDKMIRERVEAEADRRARKQFSDMQDQFKAMQELSSIGGRKTPTEDLIYGIDEKFSYYVTDLFANEDLPRFKILVELFRDCLVERSGSSRFVGTVSLTEHLAELLDVKRVKFAPALRRMIQLALMVVKYRLGMGWFEEVVDLIAEVFTNTSKIQGSIAFEQTIGQFSDIDPYVGGSMAAIEAAIGVRIIAAYAIKRNQMTYLEPLLKRIVEIVGANNQQKKPILFWPFRYMMNTEGLTSFCWEKRVSTAFGAFFADRREFVQAMCQLEFILELNSYVCSGKVDSRAQQWLGQFRPNLSMTYFPDFSTYDLSLCRPIALEFRRALESGPDDPLLLDLAIEKMPFDYSLKPADTRTRLLLLGRFLAFLSTRRYEMLPDQHFSNADTWGPELNQLIADWNEYQKQKEQRAT